MKFLNIEGKNKIFKIRYEVLGSSLWYHIEGETRVYQSPKMKLRHGADKKNSETEIRSPMPGKITHIMVKEKDVVEKNQTLLVLEAMKMEYSIKANGKSVIKKIHCKMGDQLTQDQLIIELEPV